MHKNILIVALLILGFGSLVLAAPYFRQEATVVPVSDNAYDLGTTTLRWRNIYAVTASSTNLIVSGLSAANCDVKASTNGTFSCGTDSTGTSVADLVATSTNETAGRLSYWTTTSGTPAKLGEVATTTLSLSGFPANIPSTLGTLVGGSNTTWTYWGLATTSQPSSSNLLVSNGGAGVFGVATGTISASGGVTVTAGRSAIGGALAITCSTADTNTTGCLTDTDWDTFNNKGSGTVTSIATTYPITGGTITTTGTLGIAFGTTTANTWADTQTFTKAIVVNEGTTATSTFAGNVKVTGNLQVDGMFFAPVTLVTSGNVNIAGNLGVTGSVDFDTFTSALLLTGAGGDVAEYAGASCTNQFIRSLSALGASTCATVGAGDVSLANLTATDGTLTFSGTYTGATARTIGLNLSNANTWTALQTFGNASTTQIGSTGSAYFATSGGNVGIGTTNPAALLHVNGNASTTQMSITATGHLYIPNGANPSIDSAGDLAINTTAASSSLRYFDGTAERSLFPEEDKAFSFASSTLSYMGAYGAAGTTTILLANYYRPVTLVQFFCKTDVGTAFVRFGDGTNFTSEAKCSTTGVNVTPASNNTWTMREDFKIQVGTQATNPSNINVTATVRQDAD